MRGGRGGRTRTGGSAQSPGLDRRIGIQIDLGIRTHLDIGHRVDVDILTNGDETVVVRNVDTRRGRRRCYQATRFHLHPIRRLDVAEDRDPEFTRRPGITGHVDIRSVAQHHRRRVIDRRGRLRSRGVNQPTRTGHHVRRRLTGVRLADHVGRLDHKVGRLDVQIGPQGDRRVRIDSVLAVGTTETHQRCVDAVDVSVELRRVLGFKLDLVGHVQLIRRRTVADQHLGGRVTGGQSLGRRDRDDSTGTGRDIDHRVVRRHRRNRQVGGANVGRTAQVGPGRLVASRRILGPRRLGCCLVVSLREDQPDRDSGHLGIGNRGVDRRKSHVTASRHRDPAGGRGRLGRGIKADQPAADMWRVECLGPTAVVTDQRSRGSAGIGLSRLLPGLRLIGAGDRQVGSRHVRRGTQSCGDRRLRLGGGNRHTHRPQPDLDPLRVCLQLRLAGGRHVDRCGSGDRRR